MARQDDAADTVAGEEEFLVAAAFTDVLDPVAVPVRPHERDAAPPLRLRADGVHARDPPLIGGRDPVLAELAVDDRGISGHPDVREVGRQRGVGNDGTGRPMEGDAAVAEPPRGRQRTDAYDDDVGADRGAVAQRHAVRSLAEDRGAEP